MTSRLGFTGLVGAAVLSASAALAGSAAAADHIVLDSGARDSVVASVAEAKVGVSLNEALEPFGAAAGLGLLTAAALAVIALFLRIDFRGALAGVPADWSFKDSWASTLSVGATAFVALFGAEDALGALFGEASEASLATLVVVAASAGLLVGLAPLVVKVVSLGKGTTVLGALAGAVVTLTGVIGQVLGTYGVLAEASGWGGGFDPLRHLHETGALIAVALIGFLMVYSVLTLGVAMKRSKTQDPEPSEGLIVAAILAKTLESDDVTQELKDAAAAVRAYLAGGAGGGGGASRGKRRGGEAPPAGRGHIRSAIL